MAKRPYHINLATQKNRLILKRAIKILGVTFCGETSATQARAVTKAGTSYTRDDLEATTAYVRTLAPRATGYETASAWTYGGYPTGRPCSISWTPTAQIWCAQTAHGSAP